MHLGRAARSDWGVWGRSVMLADLLNRRVSRRGFRGGLCTTRMVLASRADGQARGSGRWWMGVGVWARMGSWGSSGPTNHGSGFLSSDGAIPGGRRSAELPVLWRIGVDWMGHEVCE